MNEEEMKSICKKLIKCIFQEFEEVCETYDLDKSTMRNIYLNTLCVLLSSGFVLYSNNDNHIQKMIDMFIGSIKDNVAHFKSQFCNQYN